MYHTRPLGARSTFFLLTVLPNAGNRTSMPKLVQRMQASRLLSRGEVLVGLMFLISGIVVARTGAAKLSDLYRQLTPHFPLSLPPNVADTILVSLPLIVQTFVTTVSAICALILGIVWIVSGFADFFPRKGVKNDPADFEDPELVAESLRTEKPLHWRARSLPVRVAARLGRRFRFMSPVSYSLIRHSTASIVKIALIGVAIALVFHVLGLLPALLKTYADVDIVLTVPSPRPLYWLLALLIGANILISASLIPLKRPGYDRSEASLVLKGRGDPHFFFAMLEEGCRLLSGTAPFLRIPRRLELASNPRVRGTLIESFPEVIASIARPAGYVCLPLIVIFISLGFSRLTGFHRPISSVHYATFLSAHLPDYLLEVAFGLGMILSGAYFGEWARLLLGIRRFRSAALFCHFSGDMALESHKRGSLVKSLGGGQTEEVSWKTVEGLDPRFVTWAREPRGQETSHLQISWAEITTEAISERAPRCLADMQRSSELDASVQRLIRLPVYVTFEVAPIDSTASPGVTVPEVASPVESKD